MKRDNFLFLLMDANLFEKYDIFTILQHKLVVWPIDYSAVCVLILKFIDPTDNTSE